MFFVVFFSGCFVLNLFWGEVWNMFLQWVLTQTEGAVSLKLASERLTGDGVMRKKGAGWEEEKEHREGGRTGGREVWVSLGCFQHINLTKHRTPPPSHILAVWPRAPTLLSSLPTSHHAWLGPVHWLPLQQGCTISDQQGNRRVRVVLMLIEPQAHFLQ